MTALLDSLIERVPVALVSAARFERINEHFLQVLTAHIETGQLYIFANNASQCYLFRNQSWELEYSFTLTEDERTNIKKVVNKSVDELGISRADQHPSGMLDRETKIVFLGVNADASTEEKKSWDPDMTKRSSLKVLLNERLNEYEISIGGSHSLDITKKGINKAYAVEWLSKHLTVPPREMLFIGDALYEGGNDAVVVPTGIQTRQVTGPDMTLTIVKELLASPKW